jgi:hypothetical protein
MSIDDVRAIADAVLYEGYLLYPYRASSAKNRSRWQFGVLGPPHADPAAFAEAPGMTMQCLLEPGGRVGVRLRFLQVQTRDVQRREADGSWTTVPELTAGGISLVSWDEAVEREITLPEFDLAGGMQVPVSDLAGSVQVPEFDLAGGMQVPVTVPGGADVEEVVGARIVRRRWPLTARVRLSAQSDDGFDRLTVEVVNEHPAPVAGKDEAIRSSLIGAHLLVVAYRSRFVSLLEPPPAATGAAARCRQQRCWPVLAGAPGSADVVLGAPIILYDHPQVAEQSPGALFDSTEIDEILSLRVLTMTEAEKAEARATDPRAAAIVDRCDAMSADDLHRLHGTRRDTGVDPPWSPATRPNTNADPPWSPATRPNTDTDPPWSPATRPDTDTDPPWSPRTRPDTDTDLRWSPGTRRDADTDLPWWDPAADAQAAPGADAVLIDGIRVARGSLVRVHPARRADAQDLFFADRIARVTAVLGDVDGGTHVAVVLRDDPAADLHDWYGRYLYFAPDELEALPPDEENPP